MENEKSILTVVKLYMISDLQLFFCGFFNLHFISNFHVSIRCGVISILQPANFLSTFCSSSIDGRSAYLDPCISNMATIMGQNDRAARTMIDVTCIHRALHPPRARCKREGRTPE